MIDPERFDAAEIAILVLHHRPVGQGVDVITRRLGHGAGRANVTRLRNIDWSDKRGVRRHIEVGMKLVDLPRIGSRRFGDNIVWGAGRRRRAAIIARQQTEHI